jgi:hypothetical protein
VKRSLISLAAMAAAGAARAQTGVTLFGVVDARPVEFTPARIGPLLHDPDPEALEAIRHAVMTELRRLEDERRSQAAPSSAFAVGSYQAGKTMRLHWWQEETLRKARAQPRGIINWPLMA